jgi:uncharacterized sulfatase
MYDHSIRVPTAVRWPGIIEPGTVIKATVSNLDWFPTICDMCRVDIPADTTLHGRSIVPLLRGTMADWDNDLYAEYSTHHQSRTDMRVWRTPEWKLIRDFGNAGRDELYHLTVDPQEHDNLIASEAPEPRAAMTQLDAAIRTRMRAINDPLLDRIDKDVAAPDR